MASTGTDTRGGLAGRGGSVSVPLAMTPTASILDRLIRMPTHNPGGDELVLAQWLETELRQRGADEVVLARTQRADSGEAGAWVYARWGVPKLLVNAHLDTVPPNRGWRADPFVPRHEGGRVIGLGACDTKGAIAAVLAALDEARPKDLAVLFSGDEEAGNGCIVEFLNGPHARGLERAVVCEPTRLRVGTRHRGILAFEATWRGPGGHSSRADELPAPLAEAARLAVTLDDWGRRKRAEGPPGFTGTCLNIAGIDGGVAFNVISSEARLSVSCRPPPGEDVDRVWDELQAIVRQATPAELAVRVKNPAFQTHDPSAFIPLLGEAAQRPVDLGFWTEAALFARAGIDAVVYGPGDIAQAHAPEESVSVDELEAAREAFVRLWG